MSDETLHLQQAAWFAQNQMEVPKSTQGIFDLPVGFLAPDGEILTEVKVREITGVEEDMLAARNIPGGKKITQLLTNCVERLGPVTEKAILANCLRDLVIGDRVFLMLAIRRVSLGDELPFREQCPECGKKGDYIQDLSELPTKPMPDPKQRVFETALPSGKKARWHCMTGKEEEALAKVKVEDQLSTSIACRLDTLDGKPADLPAIKGMSLRDRNAFRDAYAASEGGVETEVDLTCPHCGHEYKTELEIGAMGFFFPSRVQKS